MSEQIESKVETQTTQEQAMQERAQPGAKHFSLLQLVEDEVAAGNAGESFAVISPGELRKKMFLSAELSERISKQRQQIKDIIAGRDKRLLVITGPCSIHEVESATEYAQQLKNLASEVEDKVLLVMRCYTEKPRTTVGWKGIINDPLMNNSYRMDLGIQLARRLLIDVAELGLPIATESLDPNLAHYFNDLVAWTAIGARTAESQTHREMASHLPMPVGFKNAIGGDPSTTVNVAVNGMQSAAHPHQILSVGECGRLFSTTTRGNEDTHIILRGANHGPNYDAASVKAAESTLAKAGITPRIMIDCSHGNSEKQHKKQLQVLADVVEQKASGNQSVFGVMLESHLNEGKQPLDLSNLQYGVSVTDACLGWEDTEQAIRELHGKL